MVPDIAPPRAPAPGPGPLSAPAPIQPADMTGFEPLHHPDQLPAPVPGHGNLLYTLTQEEKEKEKKKKQGAGQPRPPTAAPQRKTAAPRSQRPNKAPPKATGAAPKTSTSQDPRQQGAFGVELCRVGTVTVNSMDYLRLQHERWLNDTLVDFACAYLLSKADPTITSTIHVLSSMFYQRLAGLRLPRGSAGERREAAEGLPVPQRNYKRVTSFIRRVELLTKDLVIFPVCLDAPQHWFLVVAVLGAQPAVVVLDSLTGARDETVDLVVEFLEEERRVKGRVGPPFQILTPTVPQQQDGFNCGIFLTMYVERILADPDIFFAKAGQEQLADWFCTSASSGQRSYWGEVVRQLAALQAPRSTARRYQPIAFEPPGPLPTMGCLRNNQRSCFGVSAFLLLCRCGVDLHLDPRADRTEAERQLDTTLVKMAGLRRNPRTPLMDPDPFIVAVNAVLPEGNKFAFNVEQCDANELLESTLRSLALQPGFLVEHREVGTCIRGHRCEMVRIADGQPCNDSVSQETNHPWLHVLLEEQLEQPLCLASKVALLTTTTGLHTNSALQCYPCNLPVPSTVVSMPGMSHQLFPTV